MGGSLFSIDYDNEILVKKSTLRNKNFALPVL